MSELQDEGTPPPPTIPTDDLKQRTTRAVMWNAVARGGEQAIRFVVSIVLARLLMPEDFGLVAMLSIFMVLGQTLVDSGLGAALIQRRDINNTDYSTVFWANIGIATALYGVLWWSAPAIADFFDQAQLVLLTRLLALNLVGNAICVVPTSVLDRSLRFREVAVVGIISATASGTLGLYMALMGKGVWSLAWLQLSSVVLRATLLLATTRWYPRFRWSITMLRESFSFGGPLLIGGIIGNICENLYQAVIGKVYTATALGYYSKARQIQFVTSSQLSAILGRVMFPAMAKVQDNPARLLRGARTSYGFFAFMGFPAMALIAVSSKPLILVLLTEKWSTSISYLQLFCIIGALFPFTIAGIKILKAVGKTRSLLNIVVLRNGLDLLVLISVYDQGITQLLIGKIGVNAIVTLFYSCLVSRAIGYSLQQQLEDIGPYLIAAAIASLGACGVTLVVNLPLWGVLMAQVATFIPLYIGFCQLYHLPAYEAMISIIKTRKTNSW